MRITQFLRGDKRKGLTLVEVLLSVSVLTALFIVITATIDINDVFAKLQSTGEGVAVRAYGEGLTDYRWANGGEVPSDSNLSSQLKSVCKETVSKANCDTIGGVYLNSLVPDYLTKLIEHPDYLDEGEFMTGYKAAFPFGNGGRVKVTGPEEEEVFIN